MIEITRRPGKFSDAATAEGTEYPMDPLRAEIMDAYPLVGKYRCAQLVCSPAPKVTMASSGRVRASSVIMASMVAGPSCSGRGCGVEKSICCCRMRRHQSRHVSLTGRFIRTRSRTKTSGLATIW